MKTITIVCFFMGYGFTYAQSSSDNIINKPTPIKDWVVSPTGPNDFSEDSLIIVYQKIDELTEFELPKAHEALRYRLVKDPTQQNKDIVLYIEEKLNALR